jgi:hypothetical protein
MDTSFVPLEKHLQKQSKNTYKLRDKFSLLLPYPKGIGVSATRKIMK